jgi:glycosyltransferase involved in cell wall biosynthesis
MMGRKRALYVSAFVPEEKAPHAGGQAAFQNRRELERQGFDVTTIVCTTEDVDETDGPQLAIFRQTPLRMLVAWLHGLAFGPRFGVAAWAILNTRANLAFERRMRAELEAEDFKIFFCDFTQAMLPAWRAVQGLDRHPVVRACAHDLFAQKLLRDPGLRARWSLGPVARVERDLLVWIDELIVLSPKDEALARLFYGCKGVRIKPFDPPPWVADVRREPDTIARHELLFFANFDRPENAEAAAWFVKHALPLVAQRHQDVRLVLAGAGSDRVTLPASPHVIERLGFVDDPAPVFSRCGLAIAPLAMGAGVKFKVLEALACGVPVFGTPVALEGIERSALVYEATRASFAQALSLLLEDV